MLCTGNCEKLSAIIDGNFNKVLGLGVGGSLTKLRIFLLPLPLPPASRGAYCPNLSHSSSSPKFGPELEEKSSPKITTGLETRT